MLPSPSDRFGAACGLIEPLQLEVRSEDHAPAPYTFDRPWVVLGRAARSTLCLDEVAVSQRHVYLQMLAGRLFALDLESRTGIQIDNTPARAGWVTPGQYLTVGPYQLRLLSPAGPPPADVAHMVNDPLEDRLPTNGSFPLASFDIYEGNLHVARWRLNRVLSLVGRSARCRVRLPDVSVSCVHCSVVATPKGVWVVDLLSREGTRLRGEPIQLSRLEEGDLLEVGNYRLRIVYQSGPHRTVSMPSQDPGAANRSLQTRSPMATPSHPPVVLVRDDQAAMMNRPTNQGADNHFLLPLMQQFGTMQQEMFDQFQRTMMMMVQMFSTMHQEQASLLREEMRQFHKATEELQAAQRELRERQAPSPAPAPAPAPAPQAPPSAAVPPATRPPLRPFPSSGQRPLGSWPVSQGDTPTPTAPAGAAKQSDDLGIAGPPDDESDEVHDWLSKRIADLETERQSRWQRILSFIRSS